MADTPVGTAFVEIRPDLRGFEAELSVALRSALRNITPPTAGLTKSATAQTALGVATRGTTKALSEQAVVMQVNSTELARFSRGVAATSLAQFGLRGATLAATSAFLAGAASLTALAKAVGLATSFNSQLSVFGAVTGATADQIRQVSEAAKALGKDLTLPGVTATDAATAMTELAKAGLSVRDAIAGARGVLQLAGAANINLAQATEIAASALNAFGLSGRDAVNVADVLANAANAAQGSIVDVGIAFQQAAAVGHQVGLSFRDTTLFITELARAGLTGSDAGTSLRTALIRLINPTKKAKDIFKELGISIRDAQGNLRPEFFVNLGDALAKMSKKQRDATLAIIGGQDAVRALAILSRQSIKTLLDQRDALDTAGTAAKVNAARMVGLAGAGANLQNTIESLALSLGQKAVPSLVGATNAVTGFITAAAQSPVVGILGETFHVVATAVGDLAQTLQVASPILGTFVSGLAAVASAVGPSAILAGVAAYLALTRAFGTATLGLRLFLAEVSTSIALGGGLRAATSLLAESFLAFATSTAGVTLAIAALVGGLIFLASRETDTERATRRLAASTRDLAGAFSSASQAGDALAHTRIAERTDALAVATAKLGVVQAHQALASLPATATAFQRAEAQNRVLVAEQDLVVVEQRLADTRARLATETRNNTVANQNLNAALDDEIQKIQGVIDAEARRAEAIGTFHFDSAITKEGLAREAVVARIKEQADAQRKLQGDEHQQVARRLDDLALLAQRVKNVGQLRPIATALFSTKDLSQGLLRVEALLRSTGDRGSESMVAAIRRNLSSADLKSFVAGQLAQLAATFGQSGQNAGLAFFLNIQAALRSSLQATLAEIQSSIAHTLTVAQNQTETLVNRVTRIRLGGGGLSTQLSAAQAARARAKEQLAAADAAVQAARGGKKLVDAKKDQASALSTLESADAEVRSIESQIASNAQAAEAARKKKIDDAQKAKDAADQAFLTLLGEKQAPFDLAVTLAGFTKTLQDDINAQRGLSAFLLREIAAANRTIKDVHLRIQTINSLTVALAQSRGETKRLVAEQAAAAKQAIIDRRDRQQESLQLDVQIAETGKNKSKELKAHLALLSFLEARRKHTSRGSLEFKRLTLAIEQEKAAIRDLRKANQDRLKELQAAEFSFLQTQSGFAATLLSNLIPTGALAGTVGGGTGTGTTIPSANFAQAVHTRGNVATGLGAAAQTHTAQKGASMSQMATLIHVQRQMLIVLARLVGQRQHPEATASRASQAVAMDIF